MVQQYSNIPQPGNPANSEAWALIEAARRMAESVNHEIAPAAMRDALRLNWRLWTIFQADMSLGETQMPEEIRNNMLTLCQFVDRFTVEALVDPQKRHIDTLVSINRNIASGLLAGLQAQANSQEATATTDAVSSVA